MSISRHTLATATSVLLLAALAACGGSSDPEAADAGPEGSAPGARGGSAGTAPGAAGEVADVSGRTAQIQSPSGGQVAVTWDADTDFTEEVDAALTDVTIGSCVIVTAEDDVARTVRVTVPDDDGSCGFGGPGGPGTGERPDGAPTDLPAPEDLPSDAPDGAQRGFGTVGEVTAVGDAGLTLLARLPGEEDETEQEVAVDDDTTVVTTVAARADAVEVGRCVVAQGDTDDTGAVAATSISVSDPVDGDCLGGLMAPGRGPDGAA